MDHQSLSDQHPIPTMRMPKVVTVVEIAAVSVNASVSVNAERNNEMMKECSNW
jgi:hypothetical protein